MKRQEKEYNRRRGISERTAIKYLEAFKTLILFLKKDLDKASAADIATFILALEQDTIRKENGKPYSQQTKRDMKIAVKRFYEWLGQRSENSFG